jgi:hypothetical protein
MMFVFLFVATAVAIRTDLSVSAQEQALEREWSAELQDGGKDTPIQRVVKLLTEMKTQLEKEAEDDQELYDKMVCWCETEEKTKTKAIADADAKDKDLVSEIEERSARQGVLLTEIAQAKKDIGEETAALAEALEIREKEQGEFMSEEKETIQALTNLKNAIQVLSKHHGGSFLSLGTPVLTSLGTVLRDLATKHELSLGDHDTTKSAKLSIKTALISVGSSDTDTNGLEASAMRSLKVALDAYGSEDSGIPVKFAAKVLANAAAKETPKVKAKGGSFFQKSTQPAGAGESYAPASGAIFGILNQMKEDFETSLAQSQKDEVTGQEDYAALKSTKEEQVAATKAMLESMTQEQAANKKALFDAKEDLELTRETRSADVEYLRNLKVTCGDLDHQWEQRSKMRTEEIKAVSEAIAIITDDDNADMLRKTVTLLQTDSESSRSTAAERMLRFRAASVLKKMARQPDFDDLLSAWKGRKVDFPSPSMESPRARLSTLAMSVQLDAFTKVKEAMDKMVEELKVEQAEEVKLKQYCTTEFNQNEQQTYTKTEEKEDLERKMEQLTTLMERLTKEIGEAKTTIADTEMEIKKAGETREKENAEFQTTVSDQRATQSILKKALAKLEGFYKKKALLQEKQTPPGGGFAPMKKNAGASPVIGMIEQIIEESVAVEQEAMAAEVEAQKDYETMVKDSNDLIAKLTNDITEKTKGHSTADEEHIQAGNDHAATVTELEDLASYKADLHDECDFVLKNFDIRQKARLQEIEAIQEAKGILSGAK